MHSTIKIKNYDISYYLTGEGENTLVFIHGNHMSSASFVNQLSNVELKSKYKMLSFDLPGHGRSSDSTSPEKEYNLHFLSDLVAELLNKLEIKEPVVIGHSLGGHIAMELIIKYDMKGLFLVGAPPLKKPINSEECFHENVILDMLSSEESLEDKENLIATAFCSNESFLPQVKKDVLRTDSEFRKYFMESFEKGKYSNEKALVENTSIPVFHGVGRYDNIAILEYIKEMDFKHEVSQHYFYRAGHSPQIEYTKQFNKRLDKFAYKVFKGIRVKYVPKVKKKKKSKHRVIS